MSKEFIREHCLGIDLGTTNSVVSWSVENHKGEIATEVLNMDMMDITGSIKAPLLPSYIYFNEKNVPIIGKKAKSMISRQPERVIKNAKSYMGSSQIFPIGEKQVSPVEASAMILKFIGKAVEKQFGEYPKNVVITVPASFDTDKRAATVKAAELAGFKTKNEKGENLEILLSEPRAALYDYVNLQNKNEIPHTIDFRTPKNIVVFDLGGGTLDVSVHRLMYDNRGDLDIKDLGVSRYTQVGGGSFDALVGEYMMEDFIKKNNIKSLDSYERNYLKDKFQEFAEEVKLDLNSQLENIRMFGFGDESLDEVEADIYKTSVLQGYNYSCIISMKKYREIVQELLADNLSFENLDSLENIEKTENIIYPILDAMKKAQEKVGGSVKTDAVILNGGMTKFHLIGDRVEKFFNMKPHSVLDQDKSVARGASVFNFRISRGERFEKILNDTIGLGRAGEHVHHLIEAGTVLPVTKTISDFVIPQDGVKFIDLPFYLGRRRDTKSPNRKIAERRICFPKTMNAGEKVSMEIHVNEMGIMEIAGKAGNLEQEFSVKVDSEGSGEADIQIIKKPVMKTAPEAFVPTGDFIEIERTMRDFQAQSAKYDKLNNPGQKSASMQAIKRIESQVLRGINGKHFLENLLEKYSVLKGLGRERATYLLGEFGKNYPEYRRKITKILLDNLDIDKMLAFRSDIHKHISGYIRFSVEALRKIEADIPEETLLILNSSPLFNSIQFSVLMTMGALCKSSKALDEIKTAVEKGENEAAFWALGKFGSRERKEIIGISSLEKTAVEISQRLLSYRRKEVVRNAIYAIAEICDRRGEGEKIAKSSADLILGNLDLITCKDTPIMKILDIAKSVIRGEELSDSQNKVLLDLRVFL